MVERGQSQERSDAVLRGGVLGVSLSVAAFAGLFAEGCLERRDPPPSSTVTRCATCHGDPDRHGDYLLRAAPPGDLEGSTDVSYPGVGAHQMHLRASPTHGAVACAECHVIPKRVASTGHADSARPAELVFGALSRIGDRRPSYDPVARVCAGTYCHRDAGAAWTSPRSSERACGACHGLPPKAPHPQSERCSTCHGRVIDDGKHFVRPELHVNGALDFDPPSCTACHGSGDGPAPPADTHGNTASSFAGVGAHGVHLGSGSIGRPLACAECHAVPDQVDSPGHLDGVVQVVLSTVATSGGHDGAHYDAETQTCVDTWCHGATTKGRASSPIWTSDAPLACDSCHGNPPPAPHPQMKQCSKCHADVVGSDDRTIVDRGRHVDGHVDVAVEQRCTGCHGGDNPAPPPDTNGSRDTATPGVGAHQAHVVGEGRALPVPCETCHVVPEHTLDPGHVDTARPAEVALSGTAAAFGGAPEYKGGTCRDTSCHGAVFPDGNDSGGTNRAPTWTKVDGTQAACGACHGLPPPPPHPYGSLNPTCSKCHEDIASDNVTFVHPERHVDGVVTFEVR